MSARNDCRLINRDGLNKVVSSDGEELGLGLDLDPRGPVAFCPPLIGSHVAQAMPTDAIRKQIDSELWEFGQARFDRTWTTYQNGHGSCAGYAAASAVSKSRVMGGQTRIDLSGDYAYSHVNGGRDRGSALDRNMRSITKNGVATAATVPLGAIYRSKYDTRKADAEAKRFRAWDCFALSNQADLATALALRMVCVIAIHVGRRWRSFSGDVLIGDDGPGNHSEHVDDIRYNARAGRFEFRKCTSHGRNYSDDGGYCWIHWGHLETPNRYHKFYAVPAATQDPHGANPKWDK